MHMTKPEIFKIIKNGEGLKLEFKPSLSDIDRITEVVCSFANAKGGTILVGVSDAGEIKGIDIGRQTIERLTDTIVDNLDPRIYPEIKPLKADKKSLIAIKVSESPDKPHLARGKAFIRVGKNSKPMSRSEYERILLEKHKNKLRFDNQICKAATLKDIDEEKVRDFLKRAREERSLKIGLKIPLSEALERLKLTQNGKPVNAAILMFGNDPRRFFLQAEIRCARFKGIEAVKPFIDMQVICGSILKQIDEAEQFVLRNISKSAWIEPGKMERQEKWEYPPEAIREAIINAICHRDYTSTANVQIRIFDDRLEVWNPGSLPEGWTTENLKKRHESKPHNLLIADCFFMVKFIEKWGTGTIEMIKLCRKEKLPEPEFEDAGSSIIVTFRKSKITEGFAEEMGLNERQKKALLYLNAKKRITSREYKEIIGCSERTARMDLRVLARKKIVQKLGRSKNVKYLLKE